MFEDNFFDIVDALQDLYVSYRGRYVLAKMNGSYFTPKKDGQYIRLDNLAICSHLNQKYSVGIYAGSQTSKFICFDVDNGSQETVKDIISAISFAGFDKDKIYVSTSGGKGYHVEMFFDKLVNTGVLQVFYNHILSETGYDKTEVEFRPTYKQAIKLPLGIHHVTGNICWYLDQETLTPIENPDYILGVQKFKAEDVYSLIQFNVGENQFFKGVLSCGRTPNVPILPSGEVEFGKYGYPDLMRSHTTHNTILTIVAQERRKGIEKEEMIKRVNAWLLEQNPEYLTDPIPRIQKDILDVVEWAYSKSFIADSDGYRKTIFTEDEIKLLLEKRPKVQRRLLFDILLNQKKYGMFRMGTLNIAKEIGYSQQGVIKAADALESEGVISVERQKTIKVGDFYKPLPNSYRVIGKPKYPDNIWIIGGDVALNTDGRSVSELWRELIKKSLQQKYWKKYFTGKEIEELKESEEGKNE